jgi:hypothetical protein
VTVIEHARNESTELLLIEHFWGFVWFGEVKQSLVGDWVMKTERLIESFFA